MRMPWFAWHAAEAPQGQPPDDGFFHRSMAWASTSSSGLASPACFLKSAHLGSTQAGTGAIGRALPEKEGRVAATCGVGPQYKE